MIRSTTFEPVSENPVFGFDFAVHDLLADQQAALSIEIAAIKGVAIVQAGFGQFRRQGDAVQFDSRSEGLDSTCQSFLVGRFSIAEEKSKIFTLSY